MNTRLTTLPEVHVCPLPHPLFTEVYQRLTAVTGCSSADQWHATMKVLASGQILVMRGTDFTDMKFQFYDPDC